MTVDSQKTPIRTVESELGLDAFVVYDGSQDRVLKVLEGLKRRGVSTFVWHESMTFGSRSSFDVERIAERLPEARVVLAFLGDNWKHGKEPILAQAVALGKPILPVLIGTPLKTELTKAQTELGATRFFDLRQMNERIEAELVDAIRHAPGQPQAPAENFSELPTDSARYDRIVELFVDGTDEQRAETLESIRTFREVERPALAARLRHEIVQNFNSRSDTPFALALRDPKRSASVRSWMLSGLIWLDAEYLENRDLILRHLYPAFEGDRNVRFWVLAGLGQSRARYLRDAISLASSDEAPELKSLASALANPTDQTLIARFREAVKSDDFQNVGWPVLRVLRIVSIPGLAPDVARLLAHDRSGELWHYDAIYALSLPEMAAVAAKVLSDSPGIEATVSIVVRALRGSHFNASLAFAGFLSAFDRERVARALSGLRSDPILGQVTARVSAALARLGSAQAGERELSIAGYASDTIDPRADRLDISMDVRTLTAVMLADEVKPPLAIGLFGDWGSGKSFFMKSIQEAAKDLAARTKTAGNKNFCTEIVQIEFNAWHYADTNLWASLVDYILEKLAAKVSPEKTPEEKQAEILAELGSTKGIVEQARNEKTAIEGVIAEKQEGLEKLRIDRESKQIQLRDLEIADFKSLLEDEDATGLNTALDELGVPQRVKDVKELASVVAETNTLRGQLTATIHTILNQKDRTVFWLLLLVTLFGIPLLTWALNAALDKQVVTDATAFAAELGALITATTAAMRKGLTTVKNHLATVESARERIETRLAAKRKQPKKEEVALRAEIAGLTNKEQEAANRLSLAAARVVELEEKIKALTEGRSLARFLTERRQSQDYQKHLGLISTVRKDFQSLEAKLLSADKSGDGACRVDRIILYIDDLDRCPSDKVLEVLQAVHLLLAFPLFVVVVGVDPRWLRHSLATTYSALQSDLDDTTEKENGEDRAVGNDGRRDSRATPQNYLEKIFQIPFSLHRMTETGYGDLVEALLLPSTTPAVAPLIRSSATVLPSTGNGATPTAATPAQGSGAAAALTETPPPNQAPTQGTQQVAGTAEAKGATTPTFAISDEALNIQRWEARFARRLFPLIPTPRAAKRLSNVYRIVKASVSRNELNHFEGTDAIAGEFQLPMLLLAMIIKAPAECSLIFPLLLRQILDGKQAVTSLNDLEAAASEVDGDPEAFRELGESIRAFVSDPGFPIDNDTLARWIPQVSRFSFEIGGVLHRREDRKPGNGNAALV